MVQSIKLYINWCSKKKSNQQKKQSVLIPMHIPVFSSKVFLKIFFEPMVKNPPQTDYNL